MLQIAHKKSRCTDFDQTDGFFSPNTEGSPSLSKLKKKSLKTQNLCVFMRHLRKNKTR
jgi:hypothetical protein